MDRTVLNDVSLWRQNAGSISDLSSTFSRSSLSPLTPKCEVCRYNLKQALQAEVHSLVQNPLVQQEITNSLGVRANRANLDFSIERDVIHISLKKSRSFSTSVRLNSEASQNTAEKSLYETAQKIIDISNSILSQHPNDDFENKPPFGSSHLDNKHHSSHTHHTHSYDRDRQPLTPVPPLNSRVTVVPDPEQARRIAELEKENAVLHERTAMQADQLSKQGETVQHQRLVINEQLIEIAKLTDLLGSTEEHIKKLEEQFAHDLARQRSIFQEEYDALDVKTANEIEELTELLRQTSTEKQELEKKVDSLQQELQTATHDKKKAQEELQQKTQDLQKLSELHLQLKNQHSQLEQAHKRQCATVHDLETQVNRQAETIHKNKEEIDLLTTQNGQLQELLETAKRNLKLSEQERKEASQQVELLTAELQEAKEENHTLGLENEKLRATLDQNEAKIAELEKEKETQKQTIFEKRQKVEELFQANELLKEKLSSNEEQTALLQPKLKELETTLSEKTKELDELQAITLEALSAAEKLQSQKKELETKLSEKTTLLSQLRDQLAKLQTTLNELESTNSTLESTLSSKTDALDRSEQDNTQLRKENSQIQKELHDLKEKMALLTEEKTALETKVSSQEEKQNQLQEELATKGQELEDAQTTHEREVSSLEEQLAQAKKDQETALENLQSAHDQLVRGMETTHKTELGTKTEELTKLREDLEQLQANLKEQRSTHQREYSNLQQQNQQLEESKKKLEDELQQAKEELEEFKKAQEEKAKLLEAQVQELQSAQAPLLEELETLRAQAATNEALAKQATELDARLSSFHGEVAEKVHLLENQLASLSKQLKEKTKEVSSAHTATRKAEEALKERDALYKRQLAELETQQGISVERNRVLEKQVEALKAQNDELFAYLGVTRSTTQNVTKIEDLASNPEAKLAIQEALKQRFKAEANKGFNNDRETLQRALLANLYLLHLDMSAAKMDGAALSLKFKEGSTPTLLPKDFKIERSEPASTEVTFGNDQRADLHKKETSQLASSLTKSLKSEIDKKTADFKEKAETFKKEATKLRPFSQNVSEMRSGVAKARNALKQGDKSSTPLQPASLEKHLNLRGYDKIFPKGEITLEHSENDSPETKGIKEKIKTLQTKLTNNKENNSLIEKEIKLLQDKLFANVVADTIIHLIQNGHPYLARDLRVTEMILGGELNRTVQYNKEIQTANTGVRMLSDIFLNALSPIQEALEN